MQIEDRFVLTENHLKLMSRMHICLTINGGYSTIGTNWKRPFGNSDTTGDMVEILDIKDAADEDQCWKEDVVTEMERIFNEELPTAMQVVLSSGSFVLGEYLSSRLGVWMKAEE